MSDPGSHRSFGEPESEHPIHDGIFGDHPDEIVSDTPEGADPDSVNILRSPVQAEGFRPLRGVGATELGDRQPDGGRRR
jgi:hypothetical protein